MQYSTKRYITSCLSLLLVSSSAFSAMGPSFDARQNMDDLNFAEKHLIDEQKTRKYAKLLGIFQGVQGDVARKERKQLRGGFTGMLKDASEQVAVETCIEVGMGTTRYLGGIAKNTIDRHAPNFLQPYLNPKETLQKREMQALAIAQAKEEIFAAQMGQLTQILQTSKNPIEQGIASTARMALTKRYASKFLSKETIQKIEDAIINDIQQAQPQKKLQDSPPAAAPAA